MEKCKNNMKDRIENYKKDVKNELVKRQEKYLLRYEKCKTYLDYDFLNKFKNELQENKEIKKEREQLEQEFENVNLDAIWQEINEINTFDFIKSLITTNISKLFKKFIEVTSKFTNGEYFKKYYDEKTKKYILDFLVEYEDHSKSIEELKQINLANFITSLIIKVDTDKNGNSYDTYNFDYDCNEVLWKLNHSLSIDKSFNNIKDLISSLESRMIEICKKFDKWNKLLFRKEQFWQSISEIKVCEFLLEKKLKLKTNKERGRTKKKSAGPDFVIEYKGKNINIEVVTLFDLPKKHNKDQGYKTENDNFTDPDYGIENDSYTVTRTYGHPTSDEIIQNKTLIYRIYSVINDKVEDKFIKWADNDDLNLKSKNLNIICVFKINDSSKNLSEKCMNITLYNYNEKMIKPKGEGEIKLGLFCSKKEDHNATKGLPNEDPYKIIHGIWLINNDINTNNLYYNYKILEQNKGDWELLKNLKKELGKNQTKSELAPNQKDEDDQDYLTKFFELSYKCLQLIEKLKRNAWNYFATIYFEIKNILQESNSSEIERIKSQHIQVERIINTIITNIEDKNLFYSTKVKTLSSIDKLRSSLIGWSNLNPYLNYSKYKYELPSKYEWYQQENRNFKSCLSLASLMNDILKLDKKIFEDGATIKNSKVMLNFIKIIKNNNDISKGYINKMINIFKEIKKNYNTILNLIEELYDYTHKNNNTKVNGDLLKQELDKITREINQLKEFRKNPVEVFVINEHFLPKSSNTDPKAINLRKYYREYMDIMNNTVN